MPAGTPALLKAALLTRVPSKIQRMSGKNQDAPFHARLYKIGVNRAVDVPAKISESFGGGGFIPVQGWIEGIPITSTLVPRGNGRHRLFVHSRIWNRLKIEKGDFVEVLLTRGEPPKEPPIPEDLASALQMTKGAAEAYRPGNVSSAPRIHKLDPERQTTGNPRASNPKRPASADRAREKTNAAPKSIRLGTEKIICHEPANFRLPANEF